jgi:hypothetical protein
VAHDVAPLCKNVETFARAYKEEGMWGSVEQTGMIGWQVIRKELPNLKTVVLRRPLQEVYQSLANLGVNANLTGLAELNATLDVIATQPGVHSINTSDLDAPVMGKWLFEYLLEQEFDFDWWYQVSQVNIQVNIENLEVVGEEVKARYALYQEDVLRRMEEIKNCLH